MGSPEERILISAPSGRDAAVASQILADAKLDALACGGLAGLVASLREGAAAAILTEEALERADVNQLVSWVNGQPPWSDFPFVILTRRGGGLERNPAAMRYTEMLRNVSFLERPFHPITLVSLVKSALRSRQRQYQTRGHLLHAIDREAHITLLLREVTHRSKNLLAVIQGMAHQIATSGTSTQDFQQRFGSRLQGLAASHDLLIAGEWHGASIERVIASQLAHLGDMLGDRVSFSGPRLLLKPEAAQNIGMALHELSTNATKYGALANDTGRIDLIWSVEGPVEESQLQMIWQESGGPPVKSPTRKGFGDMVIRRVVSRALDATVDLDFAEGGLMWKLRVPGKYLLKHGETPAPAPLSETVKI